MNQEQLHASLFSKSRFEFSRASGPGGQNVNKVNTKATIRMPLELIDGLDALEFYYVRQRLQSRTVNEELAVTSDEERTQDGNKRRALARLETLIVNAAKIPKKRIRTRPTKTSKERRISEKKAKGETKKNRKHQNLKDMSF